MRQKTLRMARGTSCVCVCRMSIDVRMELSLTTRFYLSWIASFTSLSHTKHLVIHFLTRFYNKRTVMPTISMPCMLKAVKANELMMPSIPWGVKAPGSLQFLKPYVSSLLECVWERTLLRLSFYKVALFYPITPPETRHPTTMNIKIVRILIYDFWCC